MKIINVCGFNLSGCSAAFDLFYDYETVGSVNREFHESGFLKCKYTFGGAIQSVLLEQPFRPTKEELATSLRGDMPDSIGADADNLSIHNHLVSRKSMAGQFGQVFDTFTAQALSVIPDNIANLPKAEALAVYEQAARNWLASVVAHVPTENFHLNKISDDSIMMFKNDPPGKFPYVAGLIPNGTSFSVLRNPVDACFDFNRFYYFGHTSQTVKAYSDIFGSWVRTVKNQLAYEPERCKGSYYVVRFEDLIQKSSVRDKMLKMVGLDRVDKVSEHFQPQESTKNIGIGCAMSEQLIAQVEALCSPEYDSLIEVLREHDMLIE
ncbi:hypothetical protein N9V74_05055 [Alteromonas sp.]|nr:hypothetical protein [Alteromonas sp.]